MAALLSCSALELSISFLIFPPPLLSLPLPSPLLLTVMRVYGLSSSCDLCIPPVLSIPGFYAYPL